MQTDNLFLDIHCKEGSEAQGILTMVHCSSSVWKTWMLRGKACQGAKISATFKLRMKLDLGADIEFAQCFNVVEPQSWINANDKFDYSICMGLCKIAAIEDSEATGTVA